MRISSINFINFQAKYLKDTNVKRLNPLTDRYETSKNAFVELDVNNPEDMQALEDAAENWETDFSQKMVKDAKTYKDNEKFKIYALTSQKKNFEHLNYQKINVLGECFTENDENDLLYIKYLQVNPLIFDDICSEYKKVGSGFLDGAKSYYNRIELYSKPAREVREFYERNGFKRVIAEDYDYYWEKDDTK